MEVGRYDFGSHVFAGNADCRRRKGREKRGGEDHSSISIDTFSIVPATIL